MKTKSTVIYVLVGIIAVFAIASAVAYNQESQELDIFRFYDEVAFKQWVHTETGHIFLAEVNNPNFQMALTRGVELWHYVIAMSEPYLDYENDYVCMLLVYKDDQSMMYITCAKAADTSVIRSTSGTEEEIRAALKGTPIYIVGRAAIQQAIMGLWPWDLPEWFTTLPSFVSEGDPSDWAVQWAKWLIALVTRAT